ncbi:MAG: formimidoylglutamate deiminase [Pseudomonadota bacterium]
MIVHAARALLPEGWAENVVVRVVSGRIAEVRTDARKPSEPPKDAAVHRVDLLLPAPTNLHSHAFQRALSGLTEGRAPDGSRLVGRDSFWTWRRAMYRFLDVLTPDDIEGISALAFLEMLEAGYGAVAEFHYLHHAPSGTPYADRAELSARIVAAAETAGIGLTLLPVLYQRGGCDGRALEGGQLRFGNDPDGYDALLSGARTALAQVEDARLGVAPHSLRAVDRAGLDLVCARGGGGPVHMHVAEQIAEVDEVAQALGARPVQWVLDNLPVGSNWCLIHCTQMTDDETLRLARSGAVAGLCPITEASLGDGIFNGALWHDAGGAWGVGTDSNVEVSLWGELRQLEYSQRLRDRSRAVLATRDRSTGRVLLDAACAGGARAAARDSGALRAGLWADMVALRRLPEGVSGAQDRCLDAAIFGAHGGSAIEEVWSAGRHVVSGGRHRARDQIVARVRPILRRLEGVL